MSRRYDSKTNTFTQDGRLLQVEYAIEAINKTGSAIGILTKEGIILVTERQIVYDNLIRQDTSFLLEQSKESEKIYSIDNHIYTVVSGQTADANYLIDYARTTSQQYRYTYRDCMPVEQVIIRICNLKQSYTHYGGKRPFGTAFLFGGYDKYHKYQLYSTDPSGNYAGWKATAIGQNSVTANSYLKQEYNENLTLDQGLDLAVKGLVKTMDTANPSAKKIEIVVITKENDGEVKGRQLKETEVDAILTRNEFNVGGLQKEQ